MLDKIASGQSLLAFFTNCQPKINVWRGTRETIFFLDFFIFTFIKCLPKISDHTKTKSKLIQNFAVSIWFFSHVSLSLSFICLSSQGRYTFPFTYQSTRDHMTFSTKTSNPQNPFICMG